MTGLAGAGRLVVVAPGNTLRGDDGLGPAVAARLRALFPELPILTGAADALSILAFWEGAEAAYLVDAAVTGAESGHLHRLDLSAQPLPKEMARCSSHGLGLAEALALGRSLGRLPERVTLLAVEAAGFAPGTGLSPAVADRVEPLAAEIAASVRGHDCAKEGRG